MRGTSSKPMTSRVWPSFEAVRRETGKEYVVQVHCDEGLAIHIGPEPCVAIREDRDEASVGECTGQPLSRERRKNSGADAVVSAEGNTGRRVNASGCLSRRGRRPWHVQKHLVREPGDLAFGRQPKTVRIGKVRSRSR